MAMLKILSPWYELYNEVTAMFKEDKDIKIIFDDSEEKRIKLYVADDNKAAALEKLLKHEYKFGNVVAHVDVVPANAHPYGIIVDDIMESAELYEYAFKDNPVLQTIGVVRGVLGMDIVYVVFAKEVVQYFNDDLSDAYGQRSTLYQEIAKDLFVEEAGLFFCTAKDDIVNSPLGEWP